MLYLKKIKHEKKIINDTKNFFSIILKLKNEYTYISNQKVFKKILKQKNDKIIEKLSISKTILLYSRKFVNDNTKQLTKKIFDNNIENQYATMKTIITNYVEIFLKNDATTNKKLIIFRQTKKNRKKQHLT